MRRKSLSLFMIFTMLVSILFVPHVAMANDRKLLYVSGEKENSSSGGTIRVAMRKAPSSSADVICRIYNGTEVEQLAPASNGFVKIRLGEVEGYMMSKYLAKAGLEIRMPMSAFAAVTAFGNDTEVDVLSDAARTNIEQTFRNPLSAIVYAIAEDWAYIQPLTPGDWELTGTPGYVSAEYVLETQNFRYGWVTPTIKGETLKLFAAPNEKAQLLGEYYEGTCLSHMYWESLETDWMKVRFGHTVGYVKKGNHTGGFPAEIPELQVLYISVVKSELKLLPDDNSETLLSLEQYTPVYLIGFTKDWYHVQTDTFFENPQFGYIRNTELSQ